MSGHSKWSTIKHKKARLDARRGQAWSKLARNVTQAARQGGGNINDNPRLRLAVDKAKAGNMPKDTIEKAIKKGTGEIEGESYEEIMYEGYAAAGVAVMARVLTDNRNRTAPEVRKIFERCGGSLGTTNCVAWMFSQKGVFSVDASAISEERVMEIGLENGAEDVSSSAMVHEITCAPESFETLRKALEDAQVPVQSADITNLAANNVTLDLESARKVLRLVEELEEHDDVESVSANFDIPDDVMAQLS